MLEESSILQNLELLLKKELTKKWQKSLQKRSKRCEMRDYRRNSYKSTDWMRTKSCREEKVNEQTGKNADAADAEKR